MAAALAGLGPLGWDSSSPAWRPLVVFCLYRLLLVSLLLIAAFTGAGPSFLGQSQPPLFFLTGLLYGGAAIAFGLLTVARMGRFQAQVWLQLATDIIALTLLMHSSGGIPSGLGMLLVVITAAGGILTIGRTASALAALATLAVLLEQSYVWLTADFGTAHFTHAGLLGATLFTTALLAQVLARRLRESETLAAQRSLDLANLSRLNEYIIQHLHAGVMVIDGAERIRLLNQAARELLDLPPRPEGRRLRQIAPLLAEQLVRWRREPAHYQLQSFRPGRRLTAVVAKFTSLGQDRGTLIFLEDTSTAARQAQQLKLASLGRLTASIAHEIRNPLGAISHAAQLLEEAPCLGVGERRLVEILLHHCARVNGIVKNVLQLSRRQPSQAQALELCPWLAHFREEFCGSKGIAPAAVALQLSAPDLRIAVDPSQLQQILWNLCDNAWRHSQKGEAPCLQLRVGVMQGQTWIEVLDTGPGIPAEIADKVFEPFFTTQRTGTGLGLYVARELAECNGAHLEYRPGAKGGSCFRLCFAGGEHMEVNAA